jgi:hypothetical protein
MDGLDLLLIAMLLAFGLFVAVSGMIFEYILEKREQRALHRHVWGNVVDLKSWRDSRKRASGIRR